MSFYCELGRIAHEQGGTREKVFFDAISAFPERPSWWFTAERATRDEDDRGIDAIVYTDIGKIFVQVKSSKVGKEIFKQKRPRFIGAIVIIHHEDSDESIRHRAVSQIGEVRARLLQSRKNYGNL